MTGYTVLMAEAAEAIAPTHLFLQAGVGGLAGAAAAYARDRWGEAVRIVVVEPEGAPCLLESVRAGRPHEIAGGPTSLGRLDCKAPSLPAYQILAREADAFMTITDDEADRAAARLRALGAPVSACGAAGAAGLLALTAAGRAALALGADSRVLLIGTEVAEGDGP
jgi:diaminopropionate ammonia-lyase